MATWKQIGENLVRHRGGTVYLRAKVAGKTIRKSLETSDLRIAKLKRDQLLEEPRKAAAIASDPNNITTLGDALESVAANNALLYTIMANCKIQGLDPEKHLTEVIKRLPHNATAAQAAELTPARFAATRRAEAQAVA